jgi:hypothetical protein
MQTICRCYLSEQLGILGWLFVTTLYCNMSLPYRVNVFQQMIPANLQQILAVDHGVKNTFSSTIDIPSIHVKLSHCMRASKLED